MHITRLVALGLGVTLATACDLDVPDLNNPGIDDLEANPTAVSVGAACTGLLIGNRGNTAAENGVVIQLGILGREAYNFDQADPRYIGELIQGDLNRGSPFGGNFWAGSYANLKLGSIILHAADKVAELSAADKAAIRGFTKTIGAVDLLKVIVTHDSNGAVIDVDRDLTQPLAPIVSKDMVYAKIVSLLEDAVTDLKAAGDAFPFLLSDGYAGFDTPATFLKFNRAIRARVALYLKDYTGALTALAASFLDDTTMPDFDLGVYYSYSTKTGDTTNQIINPNVYAHPSLQTDAQMNGGTIDNRYSRKVAVAKKGGSAAGL
ncbi:MAG: RagB/SusD family nutrient uptake outer membrane protein, partial [Deltaproteobacteria bacterium]